MDADGGDMAETGTQVFRVSLNPKLYRDIEIPTSKKLYDLASAIVAAFGFDFDHAFGFYSLLKGNILRSPVKYELFADMDDIGEESDAGSVRRTRIPEAFPGIGHKMTFLFDYGDSWKFGVELIGEGTKERGAKYPRVVKRVGTSPEQYPAEEE
jgi:Plasmid pRiA4b ORF-3-like protein